MKTVTVGIKRSPTDESFDNVETDRDVTPTAGPIVWSPARKAEQIRIILVTPINPNAENYTLTIEIFACYETKGKYQSS